MTHSRHLVSALLLALPSCSAAAAGVPVSLVGEWLSGPQLAAKTYESEFSKAWTDSTRLVLNKDGSYVLTVFDAQAYPQPYGFTGYTITCEWQDVGIETGRFTVQGNTLTLKASTFRDLQNVKPHRQNNGCQGRSPIDKTQKDAMVRSGRWQLADGKLNVTFGKASAQFARRASTAPAATNMSAFLRGDWHNGAVSPIEYYNTATGKWAEASGTSLILKFGPNSTYERTGLTVVTTYGCTSKLLVTEKGNVSNHGTNLKFTPKTSSAAGYTCTPSKVSTAKNHIKPYGALYKVRVETNGQHTLTLTIDGRELSFHRPLGTPPETPRLTSGSASSSTSSPRPTSAADSQVRSPPNVAASKIPADLAKWTATGKWDAIITTASGTRRVLFSLYDDEPRVTGSGDEGDESVAWLKGNGSSGVLEIGLEVEGGREVRLDVTGKFGGDTYSGRFTTTNANDEALPGGTLTMTRRR